MLQRICLLVTVSLLCSCSARHMGSISGVGLVRVNATSLTGRQNVQTKVSCGDTVSAASKSYAKVLFVDGNKIELGESTKLKVVCGKKPTEPQLHLFSGVIGFTALEPLMIAFDKYLLDVDLGGMGGLKFVNPEEVSIRMIQHNAKVTGPKNFDDLGMEKRDCTLNLKTGTTGCYTWVNAVPNVTPIPKKP
ncbi:MAG: hypothetical protein A2832_00935 [Candidatus Zambryskibacteria bacterium RIFCSPHIGHO2_01_FULL_44_22b]|uniref:FecR protein domain-containing protein n=1 Tax=Candidatus Zambryskibacteria bacterium RIFCSPHIGHO2_01_FULL_44_22b TaxID=1802737 RepID=A0A1G2SZ02_9BACT|nr:MAG: hypothetical protein A2832_00935 [Candidatus Zambryskibacteria bacterium RIFCSPHIGHO2_01_FULL_44_22b]